MIVVIYLASHNNGLISPQMLSGPSILNNTPGCPLLTPVIIQMLHQCSGPVCWVLNNTPVYQVLTPVESQPLWTGRCCTGAVARCDPPPHTAHRGTGTAARSSQNTCKTSKSGDVKHPGKITAICLRRMCFPLLKQENVNSWVLPPKGNFQKGSVNLQEH